MSFLDLLPDTFTPQTLTETTDSQGGYTNAWTDGATFEGRLSKLPISERMSEDKMTVFASHKIFCDAGLGIVEEDRIKLGSRIFDVKAVHNQKDSVSEHHTELVVLEVD